MQYGSYKCYRHPQVIGQEATLSQEYLDQVRADHAPRLNSSIGFTEVGLQPPPDSSVNYSNKAFGHKCLSCISRL